MNLNLTIKDLFDAARDTKSGVKNGKEWTIREQSAYAEVNGETRRIVVPVPRNSDPLPPGKYTCDLLKHLRVGRFGGLELDDRLQLVAVKG